MAANSDAGYEILMAELATSTEIVERLAEMPNEPKVRFARELMSDVHRQLLQRLAAAGASKSN